MYEPGETVWVKMEVKSADDKKVKGWIRTPWGWRSLVIADVNEVKPKEG